MIPIRDVIPSRTMPVVTIAIIVINTIVFLFMWLLGSSVGALVASQAASGAPWAAALPMMFVHGGLVPFAGNMIGLWIFGENVEDRMGHGRFVAFYLLCGAFSALALAALAGQAFVPAIGAAGAVGGVVGAYLLLYPQSRVVTLVPLPFAVQAVEVPAFFLAGLWFLLQVVGGLTPVNSPGGLMPASAFLVPLAGLVAGAAAIRVFRRSERLRVEWWIDNSRQ